jgi:hypothetical protein
MNKNIKKEKIPREIVIANNKKQAEIKNVLTLRDEMVANNIDNKLIQKYINEQYEKINLEYEKKITKYNEKTKINTQTQSQQKKIKDIKKKREKAIEFLLKNKRFLEEQGASKEYIKKYVDKQYQEINEYYNIANIKLNNSESTDLDNLADFID